MNIVIPYVDWPSELSGHLYAQGLHSHVRLRNTSEADGYWHLLATLWRAREKVIVLEADKFPARGALLELWQCPHEWCTYPVAMRGSGEPAPYPSLSCTKFDSTLMAAYPDVLEHAGELDLGLGVREWSRLDMAIAGLLEGADATCHWHEPGRVEHRHR